MYKEIKKYRIFLDSGTQKEKNFTTVNLYDKDEEIIGILQFYDKGFEPKEMAESHYIYLQYAIEKYPYVIDVLRNEKPVFIGYWENEFGKYGRIYTGKEIVGEGELQLEQLNRLID